MTQQAPRYISLKDAINNRVNLSPKHIENFKAMFLKGMRSRRRMYQIERIEDIQDLVKFRDKWWSERILFYENGSIRYVSGQDESVEIPQIRNDIVGFK